MKLLKKASEILEGYSNIIWEKPEVEELAEKRLNECLFCTARSDFNTEPDKITTFAFCKDCGCNLQAKSRANINSEWGTGGCPKKLW